MADGARERCGDPSSALRAARSGSRVAGGSAGAAWGATGTVRGLTARPAAGRAAGRRPGGPWQSGLVALRAVTGGYPHSRFGLEIRADGPVLVTTEYLPLGGLPTFVPAVPGA